MAYCERRATATLESCESCDRPITGPLGGMAGAGPYKPPDYCGGCGKPFPWTANTAITDLTSDASRTPLAASRFRKFVAKVGPVGGAVLQKIVETIATEAAKKAAGL
jgi:hypothetical protein